MTAGQLDVALLDPRGLVSHPRNVRADLGDLTGLTASIAAQGVIEPLTVVPLADGGHLIVAGHRRAAAAIAAELEQVPCVVRADLAGPSQLADEKTAEHIGAMLSENLHREGLTAVEEARGIQAMLDLGGMSIAKVAKSTGLDRKRVGLAAGVARLDQGTAAMVDDFGLDLEQAAVVAVYADEPETTARLAAAAKEGPGRFAHAVERAKQDRASAAALAKATADLLAAGRVLVDDDSHSGTKNRRLTTLDDAAGEQLTPESHGSCPGSAVRVQVTWEARVIQTEVCTDFMAHGHVDRWGSPSAAAKPETDEEKEAAAAERRRVIENNKLMAAANTVRRAWVKEFLTRRSVSGSDVLRFSVEEIAARPQIFSWWLTGASAPGDKDAAEQLGLDQPVRPWSAAAKTDTMPTLTTGNRVPDGRLQLQLLAHVAGAIELGIGKDAWRATDDRRDGLVRWLRFLGGLGYTLADVEQQVLDGAPA